MIRGTLSFYSRKYPRALIYMLQTNEYQVRPYLKWHWRTNDYHGIMRRSQLKKTRRSDALLYALWLGISVQILASLLLMYLGIFRHYAGFLELGISLFISYPLIWAYLITLPIVFGRLLIVVPKERKLIADSKRIFAEHKGTKIAVAGSYGKTTMKEILAVVFAEALNVAVTPANKNVASSHAKFAAKLSGDEDVLVIEYGEGRPGDVAKFATTTVPDIGIITGLAPAHLDHYPTLKDAGKDIFSLADFLDHENTYINGDSESTQDFIKNGDILYSAKGVGKWKVSEIESKYEGVSFHLSEGKHTLKLSSQLIGRHQIGPLSLAAVLGLKLGMSTKQVEEAVRRTMPFEHRMQPRQLGGAWIIDDTYNGNIEGIRAGLSLLSELVAGRKVYVTPGLVDQGVETRAVHLEMGKLIAKAKPDLVILMRNSVSDVITEGLKSEGYKGSLRIEDDPLNFYLNLESFVAAGDLVLMQNDWPDNYY
jgi:UDP-N-acetylmuramoyl-tripeptide--D-alanyl-D-alanine ligase